MIQDLEVDLIGKRDQDEDDDLDQRAMKVHLEADLEILLEADQVPVLKADHIVEAIEIKSNGD